MEAGSGLAGHGVDSASSRKMRVVEERGAELIVLARYMQILSDDLAAFLSGRCITARQGSRVTSGCAAG